MPVPLGAAPSFKFILGTDQIGRDMLSRLLYATRISLLVGVLATAISTAIGVILGLLGGYFGGWLDIAIMRFTDMVMSFPYILLVLVAAAIFEPGLWSIILILGFVDWPGIARLVRGNVLSLRETNFVKSSIVAGMPARHILFSEILPNTVAPILVYATSVMALSMLDEASLSFLGMGVQRPTASLGQYAQQRPVPDRADKAALALDSARTPDSGPGGCHQFCGRCPERRPGPVRGSESGRSKTGYAKTGYAKTGCSKAGYAGQLITILERTQKEYIHDHPSDRMFPGSSQDP